MPPSAITLFTSLLYAGLSAHLCTKLPQLRPSRTTAPYSWLLVIALVLQTLAYILVPVLFVLGTFILPNPENEKSQSKLSFSRIFSIVLAALLDLSSLILLTCVLRALHLRLSVLRPAVTTRRAKWMALGVALDWILLILILVGQVLSVINGTGTLATLQTPKKDKNMKGIGDVISTTSFTLLVWCIYVMSGTAHNMLLLPDQVLSMLSGRLIPIFGIRAFYTLVNAVLPFVFSYPLRIVRPDVEVAMGGAVWIMTCYTLIRMLKPDTNWIRGRRAELRRVVEAAEAERADTTSPEHGGEGSRNKRASHSDEEWSFFGRWFSTSKPDWQPRSETSPGPPSPMVFPHGRPSSVDNSPSPRLPPPAHEEAQQRQSFLTRLNPLAPTHSYGSAGSTSCGESASRKGKDLDPEQRPLISGDDGEGGRVHAAIVQGSNGTGENVLYAQEGPLAPAWVLRGIIKGDVGTVEDLHE